MESTRDSSPNPIRASSSPRLPFPSRLLPERTSGFVSAISSKPRHPCAISLFTPGYESWPIQECIRQAGITTPMSTVPVVIQDEKEVRCPAAAVEPRQHAGDVTRIPYIIPSGSLMPP